VRSRRFTGKIDTDISEDPPQNPARVTAPVFRHKKPPQSQAHLACDAYVSLWMERSDLSQLLLWNFPRRMRGTKDDVF
jgi:hypothetical protein